MTFKQAATMFILSFFLLTCSGGIGMAADQKQPPTQDLRRAAAEATIIRAEYQRQLDSWTARLVRLQDALANAEAKEKGKKGSGKAPKAAPPAVTSTSEGLKK